MNLDATLREHKTIPVGLKSLDPKLRDEIVHSTRIAESMNECLWVGDVNHNTIYINPVYENLSGYKLEEVIGKPADFCFTEKDKKVMANQHRLRERGLPSQYEATLVTKSGKKIPMLISGAPNASGGTIAILTNLTKIKKMANREKIADQIIRHTTEAIVVMDENRHIRMWSTGAEKMFGYKEKNICGKSIDLLIPESESSENEKIRKEVEEKQLLYNHETRRITKSGGLIHVSVSVTKVLDERNRHKGYMVFYRDITRQKAAADELQKRFETIQDAYKELGLQKRQADYLYDIATSAVDNTSIKELNNLIVSAACMLTKCDGATLRYVENKQKPTLRLKAAIGVNPKWFSKDQIRFKNSCAEDAFTLQRPLIIHDLAQSKKHQGLKLVTEDNFKTLIVIPLMIHSQFLGTLSMYATNPSKFRLIEKDFLDRFGKQCSLAIFAKLQS